MATIGYGYGSEWHFQRWLAYHRKRLNEVIDEQTGLDVIEWLDFGFKMRPGNPIEVPNTRSRN